MLQHVYVPLCRKKELRLPTILGTCHVNESNKIFDFKKDLYNSLLLFSNCLSIHWIRQDSFLFFFFVVVVVVVVGGGGGGGGGGMCVCVCVCVHVQAPMHVL